MAGKERFDDSIVVAENVQRYRNMGYSRLRSVLLGGSEVFSAVTAASFSSNWRVR